MRQNDESSMNSVGYNDVGGCAKQVALVKELVELPLRHPCVFDVIGIEVRSSRGCRWPGQKCGVGCRASEGGPEAEPQAGSRGPWSGSQAV